METIGIFSPTVLFAIGGGLGIKLLELAELHRIPKIDRPDLKDWLYWVPFIVMPLLGGGLALAYDTSNTVLTPLLAINVGVSAPLILRAMAQAIPLEPSSLNTPEDA